MSSANANTGTGPQTAPKAGVSLSDLRREFAGIVAVDSINLEIPSGEFFALIGPSGCGKSTTLRMIAGLDRPTSGRIEVGGVDLTGTPAYKRPVNTVFQNYALFPHLTVFDNVAFGLREQKTRKPERAARVREMLELVNLVGREKAKPRELSGGQQQRVALARALVLKPKVLLFDEPLGALDLKLRRQMQELVKAIHQEINTTFLYVTHDQEEAFSISDRVGVMNRGSIEQIGDPQEIYRRPTTLFVADFVGLSNQIPVKVVGVEGGEQYRIAFAQSADHAVVSGCAGLEVGAAVTMIVRPEDANLGAGPANAISLTGELLDISYMGPHAMCRVAAPDVGELRIALSGRANLPHHLVGQSITFHCEPAAGWLIPAAPRHVPVEELAVSSVA